MNESVAEELIASRKALLRVELRDRLREKSADWVDRHGLKAQSWVLACPEYVSAKTIALYAPLRGEVPTADLHRSAIAEGKRICYPVRVIHGRGLHFRAVQSIGELVRGRAGPAEPTTDAPLVELDEVDLLVVPGLGFSRSGARLGRGGGSYDVTLAAFPPGRPQIGLTWESQLVEDLPVEAHDRAVSLVITEKQRYDGR